MNESHDSADRFEQHRDHVRAVAYRMLGSAAEADDAVQEAWLRLARVDVAPIENLGGWLTTVVSRICLDMLRARAARREDLVGQPSPEAVDDRGRADPEREMLLADEAGRALLVVLDRLSPGERVAFVLHEMFGIPFADIAPIVDRSQVATKKLASRARHRVRTGPDVDRTELLRNRPVIEAFLAASRAGDIDGVVAVLSRDVVRRADAAALPDGRAREVRGDRVVAGEIVVFGRNARFAAVASVDGTVGIVVAPNGRLKLVLRFAVEDGRITAYELIADPDRLRRIELRVLDG